MLELRRNCVVYHNNFVGVTICVRDELLFRSFGNSRDECREFDWQPQPKQTKNESFDAAGSLHKRGVVMSENCSLSVQTDRQKIHITSNVVQTVLTPPCVKYIGNAKPQPFTMVWTQGYAGFNLRRQIISQIFED